MAFKPFDATQTEPRSAFEPLPPGRYNVIITDSVMKSTKSGDGEYLALTLDVIDGEHANRKLFANLNLTNPNEKAEQIARQDLSAICHAVGVLKVTDSQELHGKPFAVVVGIEKREGYDDRNKIKGYMSTELAAQMPAGGNVKPGFGAPAANAAPAKPAQPWAKRA